MTALKLKTVTRLPGSVVGTSPVVVTASGLTYTVSLDMTSLIASLAPAVGSTFQPLDADLSAIAALGSTGILARTAANTWAQRSLTAPAAGVTITNPDGIAGNPTFVLANDLAALEGLGSTGLAARTAADTWAQRTITGPAAGITVTNGDGVAGNPTLALANDMASLEAIATTNVIPYRSAADTWGTVTVGTGLALTAGTLATDQAAFGYSTGAGGTTTQSTSKSTSVSLNKTCGQITMNNAALAAATIVTFQLANSSIAATDILVLNHVSGGTGGAYTLNAQCAAGSAQINVRNNTAGSLSEAIVIQFALIKGVNA